uniref:Putative secreted peptide n=1 Tax=Anopheles braziliensis TaxID=58242 RepID=A0A2M3ZT49_9DIPT
MLLLDVYACIFLVSFTVTDPTTKISIAKVSILQNPCSPASPFYAARLCCPLRLPFSSCNPRQRHLCAPSTSFLTLVQWCRYGKIFHFIFLIFFPLQFAGLYFCSLTSRAAGVVDSTMPEPENEGD